MKLSIIIISDDISEYHHNITQNAVNSIKKNTECDYEIIVVERNFNSIYENCKVVYFNENEFNYNRSLNFGISKSIGEYIALCNNDLVFSKGWEVILKLMAENNILSASPFSDNKCAFKSNYFYGDKKIHFGYDIGITLLGWCIIVNRIIFNTINKLNESCNFWHSDNLYAQQLSKYNINHALICESLVTHIGSKTISVLDEQNIKKLTIDQHTTYMHAKLKISRE